MAHSRREQDDRDRTARRSQIPGRPAPEVPPFDEPVEPREPLPPKPDQAGPETYSPTGEPSGADPAVLAQTGPRLTTAQGLRLPDGDHSLKAGERGPAGLAVAFGIIAMPSASAAVHETGGAAKAKSSAPAATSKAAGKKAASKAASKSASKAASSALANRPVTFNVYYVMDNGRVISEQGPGDSAAHEIENNSGAIDMQSQNESIKTGDLEAEVDGKQTNSPVTFEVEGSEQDQGEVS